MLGWEIWRAKNLWGTGFESSALGDERMECIGVAWIRGRVW